MPKHHRFCVQQLQAVLYDVDRDNPIGVKGDVIECGVGRGDNSLRMAYWLQDLTQDKIVYACDTYEGMPYTDAETSHITSDVKRGEYKEWNIERMESIIKKRELISYCVPVKGRIEETLPAQFSDSTFCFAWLDVDLYMPMKFAWEFLAPRVSPGGIIGLHDYEYHRCPGVAEVVQECIEPDPEWILIFRHGSSIFFRKDGR